MPSASYMSSYSQQSQVLYFRDVILSNYNCLQLSPIANYNYNSLGTLSPHLPVPYINELINQPILLHSYRDKNLNLELRGVAWIAVWAKLDALAWQQGVMLDGSN